MVLFNRRMPNYFSVLKVPFFCCSSAKIGLSIVLSFNLLPVNLIFQKTKILVREENSEFSIISVLHYQRCEAMSFLSLDYRSLN